MSFCVNGFSTVNRAILTKEGLSTGGNKPEAWMRELSQSYHCRYLERMADKLFLLAEKMQQTIHFFFNGAS